MTRPRRTPDSLLAFLLALFLALPAARGQTAASSDTAAADSSTGPSLTLKTSTLRNATTNIAPLSSSLAWLDTLPDLRLRMNWENPISPTSPSDWTSFGVRGIEIQLPSTPGLWLGVEEAPDDPNAPLRATLSIQRSF